jgi:hypothetical protein
MDDIASIIGLILLGLTWLALRSMRDGNSHHDPKR